MPLSTLGALFLYPTYTPLLRPTHRYHQQQQHTLNDCRVFLEVMFRSTMPKLEIMALLNPPHAKLTSFMAAREQPATMGSNDNHTVMGYVSPSNGPASATEKTGSAALTMWVKDTAIWLNETHAET